MNCIDPSSIPVPTIPQPSNEADLEVEKYQKLNTHGREEYQHRQQVKFLKEQMDKLREDKNQLEDRYHELNEKFRRHCEVRVRLEERLQRLASASQLASFWQALSTIAFATAGSWSYYCPQHLDPQRLAWVPGLAFVLGIVLTFVWLVNQWPVWKGTKTVKPAWDDNQ